MLQLNHFTQLKGLDPALFTGHYHVTCQSYDETLRGQLKDVAYVLRYSIPQIEGPAELIDPNATITTEQMTAWQSKSTWRNGSTFYYSQFVNGYVKNPKNVNDSFFLHGPDGKRLVSYQDNGKRAFYLLNIGYRPAAEQWWRDVKSIHDRYGWKHVLVDNVGVDAEKIRECLAHLPVADRVAVEYKGKDQDQAYQDAWVAFGEVGRLIMGPDVLIFGNFIGDFNAKRDLSKLLSVYDGMLREAFGIGWLNTRKSWTPADTLRSLQQTWKAVDAGKHVMCNVQLDANDSTQFRAYCFALYLMVAGKHSSFRMTYGTTYGIPPIKIPEMALDVGEPLGPFEQVGHVVTREFERYIVTVKLDTMQATFAPWTPPAPAPSDPIKVLDQKLDAIEVERQKDRALIVELQQVVGKQSETVAALEQRLNNPKVSISF